MWGEQHPPTISEEELREGLTKYQAFTKRHAQECAKRDREKAEFEADMARLGPVKPKETGIVQKSAELTKSAIVTPPQVAAAETQVWWQWTQNTIAHELAAHDKSARKHVAEAIQYHAETVCEAVGEAIAHEREGMRAYVGDAVAPVKTDLLRTAERLAEERERYAQEHELVRYENSLTRRELAVVRAEVGLQRSLETLKTEIAVARSEVPRYEAMEERITGENARLRNQVKSLEAELAKTKDRLGKMRVDQSLIDHGLKKLQQAQEAGAKTGVQVEIETSTTVFAMRGLNPEAGQTLRAFADQCLDAQDLAPIWLSPPASGTAQ